MSASGAAPVPDPQPGPCAGESRPDLPDLRPGIYRHYKGPLYQALGYGHDANNEDRVVVIYVPLHLDGAHEGPRLAVRSAQGPGDCWHDLVHPDTGARCEPHQCDTACVGAVPRFTWLGYEFTRPMLDPSQGSGSAQSPDTVTP